MGIILKTPLVELVPSLFQFSEREGFLGGSMSASGGVGLLCLNPITVLGGLWLRI